MDNRRSERDREYLPDPVASRLLERAGELEAMRRAGASVAELRAAALEAGISEGAFEEALAEIQEKEAAGVPDVRRPVRSRLRIVAAVTLSLLLLAGVWVARRAARTSAPVFRQTFSLRCIPAHEAASMLRPILMQTGSIAFQMRVPTELTISGSSQQINQAREILAKEDVPGSSSCPVR